MGNRECVLFDVKVENKTSQEQSSPEVPFAVVDQLGYKGRLHFTVNHDTLSYIPANSTKEVEIAFVINDKSINSYDFYFVPFGKVNDWKVANVVLD